MAKVFVYFDGSLYCTCKLSFVYLKRVKTLSPANTIIRGLKNLVFVFSEKNEIEETVGFFFII